MTVFKLITPAANSGTEPRRFWLVSGEPLVVGSLIFSMQSDWDIDTQTSMPWLQLSSRDGLPLRRQSLPCMPIFIRSRGLTLIVRAAELDARGGYRRVLLETNQTLKKRQQTYR